ncbi:MAG TPA: glycosyltransferase [Terracidiphilus sp.]|nr:glycosyltransferase [Terracidiphilus sp.]
MKHVAFLIPALDQLGGAERQVILLAQGLARRGWRVTVIALSGKGAEHAAQLQKAGVFFFSLAMRKGWADPRGWVMLRKWIRAEMPDVLHAHLPHAVWMARWVRLLAPVRVVVDTIHTSAIGPQSRRRGYRCSNWLTDQTTAVSRDAASAYSTAGIVWEKKLTVVPNAVDVAEWNANPIVRAGMRREHGIENKFLWFASGRLEAVKDYSTLLHAFSMVDPQSILIIAGDGVLRDGLERLAGQLGIHMRVKFLGFIENPMLWMQSADGFVQTSRWEGLPMSVLEAGACALPTVATNVAGTRELIVPGQTGLLVEAGNVRAIAAAMQRMMNMNTAERAAMGECARMLVLERYAMDPVLDRWEKLFGKLLEQNTVPRRWGSAACRMPQSAEKAAPTMQ